jgi:hypothetical protein
VGLTTDKVLRLCLNQQFSIVSTGEYGFIYLQARLTTRQRTIAVKKGVGLFTLAVVAAVLHFLGSAI